MHKWEYLFVSLIRDEWGAWAVRQQNDVQIAQRQPATPLYEVSNRLGEEGWELFYYSVASEVPPEMIFKRPKQEEDSAQPRIRSLG